MTNWLIRFIICMPLLFVFALVIKYQLIEPYRYQVIEFDVETEPEPVLKKGDREI